MIRRLRSILSRPNSDASPAPARDALPRPEFATYVIGDLHGRADLLERALDRIDEHVGRTGARNPQVVFVGNYIDHGPDSAATLTRVWELSKELPKNVTCLMGNHERMLLDFLSDPKTRGPRWLRSGARPTLDSFGLHTSQLEPGCAPELFRQEALALRSHMSPALLDWLENLPLSWNSGNLWVVHAAADPQHAMEDQSPRVLLWGHPEFDTRPRSDSTWIVHGHTSAEAPVSTEGRICVDCGAWQSGLLCTAAMLPDGRYEFLYA